MKLGCIARPGPPQGVDFVALGENSLDTLVRATGIAAGSKSAATDLVDLPGGQAATAAVACARLGWRARYVGVLGDDEAGRVVQRALEAERVDVAVFVRAGVPTRRAAVLIDPVTGDRTIVHYREPALDFAAREDLSAQVSDASILLVDGSDVAASVRAAAAARAAGVRTLVDVDRVDAGTADLLRLIDVIIVPAPVVAELSGSPDLGKGLARVFKTFGGAAVVATLGADGALAHCRGQEVRVGPAETTKVQDTTGAGDAFRAGFAAAWLGSGGNDPELEQLMRAATLVAGLATRGIGAQTTLPRAEEVPQNLRGFRAFRGGV